MGIPNLSEVDLESLWPYYEVGSSVFAFDSKLHELDLDRARSIGSYVISSSGVEKITVNADGNIHQYAFSSAHQLKDIYARTVHYDGVAGAPWGANEEVTVHWVGA